MENALGKIDHIVVLMMENRSFDSLLGWLYDENNAAPFQKAPRDQHFEGVSNLHLSNPVPGMDRQVPVGKETVMTNPQPDPGEGFAHTNLQLFGQANSETHNLPPELPEIAPMNGFVADYLSVFEKSEPTYEEYSAVMNCFTPDTLPVLSTLANSYAVCDHYFASLPSQTLPNRAFVHAATSSGYVDNAPFKKWVFDHEAFTIYQRISEADREELTWKIYFDEEDHVPGTLLLFGKQLFPYYKSHFFSMHRFERDAREGTLPSYSFIEPRLLVDHNDQHPSNSPHIVTSSLLGGEELINRVYQAVRNGKNWERTLLIICYDEHGGSYDHVSPPKAVPPQAGMAGEYGFAFDRLGVRLPLVLVSPYIEAGTVFRAKDAEGRDIPLDHTSIIKTVTNRWGLEGLTDRDKAAADLSQVLTLKEARTDFPIVTARPYSRVEEVEEEAMTDLHKAMHGLFVEHVKAVGATVEDRVVETVGHLSSLIKDHLPHLL